MDAFLPLRPELDRLPSGRHGLTPEAVAASQRGRILFAIAKAVAAKGYAGTTVADVVELAGVSRRTFYEQFPDKESCFLAAYDTGVEVILGQIRRAVAEAPETDWRGRARTAVETYMRVLADEPDFAWATHVEILAGGREALERRTAIIGIFVEVWRRFHEIARMEDPTLPELPLEAYHALTGGLEEMVRDRMRTHGARSLPEYSEAVLRAIVSILGGGSARSPDQAARRRRKRGRGDAPNR